jgi:hypothetical protein
MLRSNVSKRFHYLRYEWQVSSPCRIILRCILDITFAFTYAFLLGLFFVSWRWRRYVPPKRHLTFNGLHGVMSEETEIFITTAVRTSNPTLINSMDMSPSWEAVTCAVTQELPSSLWSPKVRYTVYKSPPLVPILRQIDPVHTTTPILILSTHLRLGLHSGLFPSGFPINIPYTFLFSLFGLHDMANSSS